MGYYQIRPLTHSKTRNANKCSCGQTGIFQFRDLFPLFVSMTRGPHTSGRRRFPACEFGTRGPVGPTPARLHTPGPLDLGLSPCTGPTCQLPAVHGPCLRRSHRLLSPTRHLHAAAGRPRPRRPAPTALGLFTWARTRPGSLAHSPRIRSRSPNPLPRSHSAHRSRRH